MFTIAAIKAFFKGGINIFFVSLIVALLTIIGVSYMSNKAKDKEIASLNTKLGAVQTSAVEFQTAANDCTAGVTAVQASEAAATQAASDALAKVQIKADQYDKHASKILSTKPTGSDDYTNSKALMDQLVTDRQAQINGAQQ